MTYDEEREAARADLSEEEMAVRIAEFRANKYVNRHAIITINEPHLLPCQMSALADFASTLGSGVFVSSDAIYRLKSDDELEKDVVSAHMHELRQRRSSITCE